MTALQTTARAALLLAAVGLATTPLAAAGTKVAGKYGDWALHINESANSKICFAAAEPKEKAPKGVTRAPALFYISAWPKEGVKSEVSVKLGYPIQAKNKVTVTIGKDSFKLFAKEERAFVADAAEEQKLIEAMRKGTTMTVQATNERGTATTDTYSLSGLGQALQALSTTCK
jgi:invasion protein IalB